MVLGGRYSGRRRVPVEAGYGARDRRVVLQAVVVRHHHASALVLSHLHLPLPGGGGAASVDINGDGVTGGGGRDEHVLAGVVA